jgi:hypothetical protein
MYHPVPFIAGGLLSQNCPDDRIEEVASVLIIAAGF